MSGTFAQVCILHRVHSSLRDADVEVPGLELCHMVFYIPHGKGLFGPTKWQVEVPLVAPL